MRWLAASHSGPGVAAVVVDVTRDPNAVACPGPKAAFAFGLTVKTLRFKWVFLF